MLEASAITSSPNVALCLGHPGHEMRILGWCKEFKPLVSIITDGSGPDRVSRLESTRKVLASIGCRESEIFGKFPDREVYLLMRQGPEAFINLAERLLAEWEAHDVRTVAGDGLEGANSTHDVCRMIVNAVVEKRRQRGVKMKNYEFSLESLRLEQPEGPELSFALDEETFQWKREVVRYGYPELAEEVETAITRYGEARFRAEIMSESASGPAGLEWDRAEPPIYESYGARQIEKGHYVELITYREHLQPIAEALWDWALD